MYDLYPHWLCRTSRTHLDASSRRTHCTWATATCHTRARACWWLSNTCSTRLLPVRPRYSIPARQQTKHREIPTPLQSRESYASHVHFLHPTAFEWGAGSSESSALLFPGRSSTAVLSTADSPSAHHHVRGHHLACPASHKTHTRRLRSAVRILPPQSALPVHGTRPALPGPMLLIKLQ